MLHSYFLRVISEIGRQEYRQMADVLSRDMWPEVCLGVFIGTWCPWVAVTARGFLGNT